MKTIKCNNCGSNEFTELGNGNYVCSYCGAIVESERPVNNIEVNNYSVEEDSFGDDPYLAGGKFARDYENGTFKYRLADPEYAEEYTRAVNRAYRDAEMKDFNEIVDLDPGMHRGFVATFVWGFIFFIFMMASIIHPSVVTIALMLLTLIGYGIFALGRVIIHGRKIDKNEDYYNTLKVGRDMIKQGIVTKEQVTKVLDEKYSDLRK